MALAIALVGCVSCNEGEEPGSPADKKATHETVHLYDNLGELAGKGYMFGHQDDLAYGVGWKYEAGRSDVKESAGDYPAMYGWELGHLEIDSSANLDSVPFDRMKQMIREGYDRGGVITISWHATSPFGYPNGAWDTTHGTVASINPGGAKHTLYRQWLDKLASFFSSLKGSQGEPIPVLFRPFHEHTGNWFWWGRNACSDEEYKTLWRFTFNYLQGEKNIHNLLWVYNTAGNFESAQDFLQRYPGDDLVDIISFDAYQHGDPQTDKSFEENTNRRLEMIGALAKERNKLFALAETGYEAVPYPRWWTQTLTNAIGDNKISYVLVWRNHGFQEETNKMHYYAPHRGQASEADFKEFYKLDRTLFEGDVRKEKLYQ